nr:EOG090X0E58 [Eulimnadia texana]
MLSSRIDIKEVQISIWEKTPLIFGTRNEKLEMLKTVILGFCRLALAKQAILSYLLKLDSPCVLSLRGYNKIAENLQNRSANIITSVLTVLKQKKFSVAQKLFRHQHGVTYDMLLKEGSSFDIAGKDVLVFLHIQKTGGTIFGRHLVRDLDLDKPCVCHRKRKRCDCFRPFSKTRQWLFSRYSTGWKCGLHADWTELTPCVDQALDLYEGTPMKRRYFYITILRDPVHRYLSEFRHVQRGATWKHSRHFCGGKEFVFNIPKCYKGDNWTDVELDDFMNCPHNLANNRQTRMLADLNLVGCYNSSLMDPEVRDQIMLTSAKTNLARMAFFGLTEQQQMTQYVFEETFQLDFLVPFEQYNATLAYLTLSELNPEQQKRVKELNRLDIELYQFAVDLLNQRFEILKSRDGDFPHHWNRIITKSNETVDVDFEQESS